MSDPKRAVEGRRVLWRRPEFWLLAVGAALSLAKLYLLEVNSREILECRWCLAGKGVPHELGFILTIAALYAPSALPRWRPLRWALRALVLALLLITLADLVVIRLFVMRLSWDELVKFIPETEAIEAFVRQLIAGPWRSALALWAARRCSARRPGSWPASRSAAARCPGSPRRRWRRSCSASGCPRTTTPST